VLICATFIRFTPLELTMLNFLYSNSGAFNDSMEFVISLIPKTQDDILDNPHRYLFPALQLNPLWLTCLDAIYPAVL
jgi:hypothetical protein